MAIRKKSCLKEALKDVADARLIPIHTPKNRMKDRILQIMQLEGLSASEFAEEISILRSTMAHITSGRSNPSLGVCTKIPERFTCINPDWLLFGAGKGS